MKHWIVYPGETCDTFEPCEAVPTGSRILADEIDGMTKSQAMRTLTQSYERVWTHPASERILAYKEGGVNAE